MIFSSSSYNFKQDNVASCFAKEVKEYHTYVNVGNDNNQEDPLKNSKYNYTKIIVEDPYNS